MSHANTTAPLEIEATATTSVEVISIDALIKQNVEEYHLNYKTFYNTLDCESQGFKDVSIRGDNGLARGLAQIRSDYHPDITDAEADDPVFAVHYMAQEWSKGNENEWSCYKMVLNGWQ